MAGPSNRFQLLSTIPRSELSYRGIVQRTAELKFNIIKSENSEIQAIVHLPKDFNQVLTYKWTLGDRVTLHQGTLKDHIENYEKNTPLIFKILVKGFNTSDLTAVKHIRFEIISDNLNYPLFADGIVSNNQENSFEEIVKEVENYKKNISNEK